MVLDLLCVLIVVGGGVLGYFKGLFKMVARLASIIIAFLVAISVAGSASTFVYKSVIVPTLQGIIVDKVEETGAEEFVTSIYDTVNSIQDNLQDNEIVENIGNAIGEVGNTEDLSDIYEKFNGLFGGLSPTITNFIATEVDLEQFSEIKSKIDEFGITIDENINGSEEGIIESDSEPLTTKKVAAMVTDAVAAPIIGFITPIAFALMFFIVSLVTMLLLNFVVALLEKISITEKLSKFGGMGVGAICAIAIAIALAALASVFITPASDMYGLIDGSLAIKLVPSISLEKDMMKII